MSRKRKQKAKDVITQLEVYKSVRKSWGTTDPRTTIKQSDKLYKRAKSKRKWKQQLNEED